MATILVIDDEQMICDLLRSVFSAHGHEVLTATNGRKGLELFRQRRPRFTLLDLHMPEMDGIEALRQIRAIDPGAGVIMLTGGATDVLEIRARGLGVTDFLRKGLPLEVLVKTMEKVMQRSARITEAPPDVLAIEETSSDSPEPDSIVLVDDDPQICNLVSQFLTERGYRVRIAKNGQAALVLLEQESSRLVITDIYMPFMNGVELIRELRARGYPGGILALSGSQDEKKLQELVDLGAIDIIGKPVVLETLELAVQLGCILTTPGR